MNTTSTNPFMIIWLGIKGLINKQTFSVINFFNLLAVLVTMLPIWGEAGLITPAISIFSISLISFVLKWRQSHSELVGTGLGLDPVFYLLTITGMLFGGFEQFMNSGYLFNYIGPGLSKAITIIYSLILILLRTGFTNQSTKSIAARKAS